MQGTQRKRMIENHKFVNSIEKHARTFKTKNTTEMI
jgi:hypothetical protein